MTNSIKFRMVAYTGPAGKADPSAPMGGNEDNFYVDDNLSDNIPCHFDMDKILDLAEYGLIMAVADGMGGQNAGEVASGIAVKTVQEFFAPGALNDKTVNTPDTRKSYLEKVVVEADRRIKEEAQNNPEHEGMGSTIILAWILGDKLTITWCGDSRAYRYNPAKGIELLSEDHSYVQELVKQKVISYDDTFDHPQGNIVTRSLGERGNKAQPETRQFNLYRDDIILLCSDGLSGVLRDKKTFDHNGELYPGENIEDIIKKNSSSMKQCKDALWDAAERADWYDNITIILCQILDGVPNCNLETQNSDDNEKKEADKRYKSFWSKSLHITTRNIATSIGIIFFVTVLLVSFLWRYPIIIRDYEDGKQPKDTAQNEQKPSERAIDHQLSALKEGLLSRIQKECADFMRLRNIEDMEKDEYFKDIIQIISEFNDVNDSLGIKKLQDYICRFIALTGKRTNQLETINRHKKEYQDNSSIIQRLDSLREKCIREKIDDLELNNLITEILTPSSTVQPENCNGNEDTTVGDESGALTPVTIEEQFSIINWSDFVRKVVSYRKKYKEGYTFKGVYIKDVIVYNDEGYVVEEKKNLIRPTMNGIPITYTIKFIRE